MKTNRGAIPLAVTVPLFGNTCYSIGERSLCADSVLVVANGQEIQLQRNVLYLLWLWAGASPWVAVGASPCFEVPLKRNYGQGGGRHQPPMSEGATRPHKLLAYVTVKL